MLLARTTETDTREFTPPPLDPRAALGLLRPPGQRTIPIHMLYEGGGSALYEAIERHPDYYPYATERALLEQHAAELVAALPRRAVLIELGCGDCTKTRILLDALVRRDGRAHLVGIDSSADALASTRARLEADPAVTFTAIHDTFFDGLARAAQQHEGRDLCVLLLGSTLGNMSFAESELFLRNIVEITARTPGSSTRVLLGLDMWQDEGRLRRAYDNDITARFELNGLRNAIHSLDRGHAFDPDDWRYVVEINPTVNQVEMLAEAARPVGFAGQRLARGERILLEVSHKFRPWELERLFTGCAVVASHGDVYRVFVLAPGADPVDNPWTRYGDGDLDDIDGVARIDYGAFIARYDWSRFGADHVALLDVGCGSGAVARMLRGCEAARRFADSVGTYDILDVSANSLRIAGDCVPFPVGRKYHVGIEALADSERFVEARAGYDVVWSIHGITAVPPGDLDRALLNMLRCARVGGTVLIVISDDDSHYAAIDRAYLADRAARGAARRDRFLVAEDVVGALRRRGVQAQVLPIATSHVFPARDRASWRNFNAWCVYDDAFDVARGGPATSAYLDACWDAAHDGYRLRLSSSAITVERDALTVLRWLTRAPGATVAPLAGDAYARGCAAFEGRSTQRRAITRHLAASGVIAGCAARGELRVLSVGCGDGAQDLAMLGAALGDDFRGHVDYVGVDTCPVQRARCAATLAAADGRVGQATLTATVRDAHDDDTRYDCVLMLHVLYYVDDLEASLRAALDRLAAGGKLIVWHAPLEAMNQLAGAFWGEPTAPIPFADDVARALAGLGATFTRHRIDGALRLGPRDDVGRDDALSFLVQADCRALDPAVRDELEAAVEQLTRADGTIAHPASCFIVERPGA